MVSFNKVKGNELYNAWIESISRSESVTHLVLDYKRHTNVNDNHMNMKMLRACLSDNLHIGKNLVELVCCGIDNTLIPTLNDNNLLFDFKPRPEVMVPYRMKDLKSVFEQ